MESLYCHVLDVGECLQAYIFLIFFEYGLFGKPRSVFGVEGGLYVRLLCEAYLIKLILAFHFNLSIK